MPVFNFFRNSVGQKVVMAVTGALLMLFLVGHMLGNLQIFLGPEKLNAYAGFLKKVIEPLWGFRLAMAAAILWHIIASAQVTWSNWKARPVGYAVVKHRETNYAARTMIFTGPLIFLFVIYHLMMFTFLVTNPDYDPKNVYGNVVQAFQNPAIAGVYMLAVVVLGFHLYHAGWSMLQTLGLSHPKYNCFIRIAPAAGAVAIACGYISIPIAVLSGAVG